MTIISTIEEAGVIAVRISENIEPKLTSHEEGFFIAGFQECIKYLNSHKLITGNCDTKS